MRSTPTVAQLRAFVAVAQFQHFRDAAASLGVSQPTLSQSLAAMETRLGVRLVERNPRKVIVTPEGEFLLPLAKDAVAAVDAFRTAALPDTWLTGPLHVGVIPTIAPYLLPSMLPAVHQQAPDLALHVKDPRVHTETLYAEDFVLAVPAEHPWAGATDVLPSQLRDEELLFLEEGHCLRDQAVEVCLQSGVAHAGDTSARAASLSTIVQLVSAGLGMTFLPDSAVKVETRGAHLGVARFAEPAPGRSICLVHRRSSTRTEEFEDFAEILRRAVADGMPSVRRA
jgi:LysR family hydrogen peroxide-inducible transcriptional activator